MKTYIENDLVQKLEGIAQEHQGDDAEVDSSSQGREVHVLAGAIGIVSVLVEELPGEINTTTVGGGIRVDRTNDLGAVLLDVLGGTLGVLDAALL